MVAGAGSTPAGFGETEAGQRMACEEERARQRWSLSDKADNNLTI